MKTIFMCCTMLVLGTSALQAEPKETPFNIMVGEASWLPEASTIAKALDHESGLRIMPVLGRGSVQAVQDLENFPTLDAALVTADSLTYVKAQSLMDPADVKLTYISAVKPLPIVLVAARGIPNITALAGKRIATGTADSASFASGELLMGAMEVPFLRVPASQEGAVDALLAGQADAAFFVGVPTNLARLGRNFRVLSLVLPTELTGTYQAAKLTSADLPGLIPSNAQLDTVSTELILAANSADTSKDHAKAMKAFTFELFRQSTDSTNMLRAEVPGWTREANAAALVKTMMANAADNPTITPTGATP
ncbi:TAXI family TRAP transporter solute-binding subunit [Aestuariivirga litoralis]|uniref:TAXI family TRAP transporter solute-binding subunit n=1 Tax=Aestuariivirga litoralis TaxID=2650924 RepID=UPI0018C4A395|nr:TAXI family TRAP transporter solute-binding subunit [Aestuariivirga litoralis]MBG1231214.1 hypothetical protein [Aestuariivirga litoralis]